MNVSRTILASLLCSMFLALSPVAYSEAGKNGTTNPGDASAVSIEALRARAERGDAEAQFMLGERYFLGKGVPQNEKEAAKWYHLAAEQGHAQAQYELGVMYDNGQGVPQNDKEATKWFRLAAEQGIAEAQYNLGVMYELGEGVPQNYKEAAKWYRPAAEQGIAQAQYNLGVMYALGQGVPEDYLLAYALSNLAASQDPSIEQAIETRDLVAEQMSQKDVLRAQELTLELAKPGNFGRALDAYLASRRRD